MSVDLWSGPATARLASPIICYMASEQIKSSRADASENRFEIHDPATISALADPTRLAILGAVAWGGARTIREVAERIGRRPGSLYRQFDVLEGLGLLQRCGSVETSRRDARLYQAHPGTGFVYQQDKPDVVDAINSVVASAARNAARAFARSTSEGAVTRGPHRDTHMTMPSGWLDDEELAQFNHMVDALGEFLMTRERRPGARLVQTTVIVAPGAGTATARRNDA